MLLITCTNIHKICICCLYYMSLVADFVRFRGQRSILSTNRNQILKMRKSFWKKKKSLFSQKCIPISIIFWQNPPHEPPRALHIWRKKRIFLQQIFWLTSAWLEKRKLWQALRCFNVDIYNLRRLFVRDVIDKNFFFVLFAE
jgi:hypothetical protein